MVNGQLEPGCRLRRTDSVAHRVIDDEVLLIPIRTDPRQELGVYTLNRTAAFLWNLLDQERTVGDLADCLCARFEVAPDRARSDVAACCQELMSFGAIEKVQA